MQNAKFIARMFLIFNVHRADLTDTWSVYIPSYPSLLCIFASLGHAPSQDLVQSHLSSPGILCLLGRLIWSWKICHLSKLLHIIYLLSIYWIGSFSLRNWNWHLLPIGSDRSFRKTLQIFSGSLPGSMTTKLAKSQSLHLIA